jgi:hypothetical protein
MINDVIQSHGDSGSQSQLVHSLASQTFIASIASYASIDLRYMTSILVELKTLSTSAIISGLESWCMLGWLGKATPLTVDSSFEEVLLPMLEARVISSCSSLE